MARKVVPLLCSAKSETLASIIQQIYCTCSLTVKLRDSLGAIVYHIQCTMQFDAMCCDAMRCDAMRCNAMRCYATLRYATLCYAMLCYNAHSNDFTLAEDSSELALLSIIFV